MKKLFTLAAAMLAVSAFAYGELRVDVRCGGDLTIKSVDAGSYKSRMMKPGFALIMTPKLTNEWQNIEFSFTPADDGRVSLCFQTPGSKKVELIQPVLIDDIKVTGAEFRNGSFELLNKKGALIGWRVGKSAKLTTSGAAEGNNCMMVTYGKGIVFQTISVTGDTPVKVTLKAKLAK